MRNFVWIALSLSVCFAFAALAQTPAGAQKPAAAKTKPSTPPANPIPIATKNIMNPPAIEVDRAVGYFAWMDKDGFHIRWTTDKKPVVFSGRIDFDKNIKEIKRLNANGSGWAKAHGDRLVMFSTTSRGGEDGLDLVIPGVKKMIVELKIDGNIPAMDQVSLGSTLAHPTGLPMAINF